MQDINEIIESEVKRPSVFIDESKLYPEYVPDKLPHREEQVRQLTRLFKSIILRPGTVSVRTLLVGPIGSGKTVTSIVFGTNFSRLAERKGVNIRYVHVNCSKSKNPATIFREIKNQLGLNLPDRGLSATELGSALLKLLDMEDLYLLVALDEFDYFLRVSKPDDRYMIVRFYDVFKTGVKRLNFIYITRGTPTYISSLVDDITGSYLMKNIVMFNPYKSKEIFDILKTRAEVAFYPGVISDDVLDYIANLVGTDNGGDGNARKALAVLHAAGKLADKEMLEGRATRVTIDHVRAVFSREYPSLINLIDALHYLPLHELLVLKAIALALLRTGEDYVSMGVIEGVYRRLCSEIGEEARGHTKVYTYVMDLRHRGIIITRSNIKGRRGRSTYVSFGAIPLNELIRKLDHIISSKRLIQ